MFELESEKVRVDYIFRYEKEHVLYYGQELFFCFSQ